MLTLQEGAAEEEERLSREHFEKCVAEEEAANEKELLKYQTVDRLVVKSLPNFFQQRKKFFMDDSDNAICEWRTV